ncbi:MAG TPA: retropepsin-like aspartic protease [Candidatus Acidoferrales bacterium]|nr:retropepsin-like aspartic protease [Candidatus Acidoferrales bacterium]
MSSIALARRLIVVGFAMGALTFAQPSAADDKPPAGIVPSTATLDSVLAGYDKARSSKAPATMVEDGRVQMYGLSGTYHDVYSQDDYMESTSLGVVSWANGSSGGQRWYQNENGIVTLEHDTHQENEIAHSALAEHTKNSDIGLSLAGESLDPAAYVIEIHAQGGRHEWQYFDKKSYELVRSVEVYPDRRVTTTFDDYHTTGAYTAAWHVHVSDGFSQNDVDYVTTGLKFDEPVNAADLNIPQSNPNFVQFPAGTQAVQLPAKIVDGRVIVQVTINGRGLDFQLDSGASSILIDADVAKQLGLKTFGRSTQTAAGNFEDSEALIPDLGVGAIHMKNVAVDVASFNSQEDRDTQVVGLLGFDFIASAMVEIDYKGGTVQAMLPYLFVPPANAIAVDAYWDDGVPKVQALVGDVPANFIIDTGADDGIIFSSFARAHADVVRDQGAGHRMLDADPFMHASGVGGEMSMTPTQVKALSIGGATFNEFVMYEVDDPGFEVEDYAGLLGHNFLDYFTLYLDYRDNHIYLIPNSNARG